MGLFSGPGLTPSLKGTPTNVVSLAAGECWTVSPAGWYVITTGKYTTFQQYDPITGIWRTCGAGQQEGSVQFCYSDGVNYRLSNETGTIAGALVTNAGSNYTSAPAVTAAGSNALFRAIIGGAINTTITVTNGGTTYTYPPIVLIQAPPAGGVQATAHAVLTSNAVSSVVVDDQGAGYSIAPIITFVNDPREGVNNVTTGANASAIATLTGAGTITAIVCIDHGTALTGQTAVPALTISGGGGSAGAATAVMDWSIQAYTVTTSGTGYSGSVIISAYGPAMTGAAYTNPTIQANLVNTRAATIIAGNATNITTAGLVVLDGGVYQNVPSLITYYNQPPTTAATLAFTLGGSPPDSSYITQV